MPLIKKIGNEFFSQKTEIVAKNLLGKVLVRKIGTKILSGMIVETEAYIGPHDLACHASRGKTTRTHVMFNDAGCWYVYLIYGCYHCLNIVTEAKDYPAAVLIRALEPLEGIAEMRAHRETESIINLTSGPGKLCQALRIDTTLNSTSAIKQNSSLFIEDHGIHIPTPNIVKTKRIGVDYAGVWKNRLLRFHINNNRFVSKSR